MAQQRTPAAKRSPPQDARTERVLRVLKQFRELFRVSQQHFQRIEEKCGVSGAQLWALSEIRERPGLSVSELSNLLSIELPTASNLLARLGARRLVRRERSNPDQRVVRVFLTPEGERLVQRAPRPAQGIIQAALVQLSGTALKRLNDDLEAVLRAAGVRHPREQLKLMSEMPISGNGSARKKARQ